ncbi:MAG: MBL fold metallo-hydrolase [Gammaproteobacteria bacterium]|nr:MBL fold metallo-hydrolase [Gammaproteobacteria bacterium]
MSIPFVRDLEIEYGRCDDLAPGIRRVVAGNPSAFTFHGTGTYIIGRDKVAVIDPGPAIEAHVEAIMRAVHGETVSHILVTHTHNDHSPACRLLQPQVKAPTYGYGPHGAGKAEQGVVVEEGGDLEFEPDERVRDGQIIDGGRWQVDCVHTPGHTSNHICFGLHQGKALFSGDHVMGWSTSVISPPDGDMRDYMASLRKLLDRDDAIYWPTHGPAIRDPKPFVHAFIAHREAREAQILACLEEGMTTIEAMVAKLYAGVSPGLHRAAGRSVLAHLQHMVDAGRAACEGAPALDSQYRAVDTGSCL